MTNIENTFSYGLHNTDTNIQTTTAVEILSILNIVLTSLWRHSADYSHHYNTLCALLPSFNRGRYWFILDELVRRLLVFSYQFYYCRLNNVTDVRKISFEQTRVSECDSRNGLSKNTNRWSDENRSSVLRTIVINVIRILPHLTHFQEATSLFDVHVQPKQVERILGDRRTLRYWRVSIFHKS